MGLTLKRDMERSVFLCSIGWANLTGTVLTVKIHPEVSLVMLASELSSLSAALLRRKRQSLHRYFLIYSAFYDRTMNLKVKTQRPVREEMLLRLEWNQQWQKRQHYHEILSFAAWTTSFSTCPSQSLDGWPRPYRNEQQISIQSVATLILLRLEDIFIHFLQQTQYFVPTDNQPLSLPSLWEADCLPLYMQNM